MASNIEPEQAQELIALAAAQRETARSKTQPNQRLVYRVWAVTYFVAYGGIFLLAAFAPDYQTLGGAVVSVCGSIALFVVILHNLRRYQGVRGTHPTRSILTGVAWLVALALSLALNMLTPYLTDSPDRAALLVYVAACVLIGVVYLITGIGFADSIETALGAWLVVTGLVSFQLGMPWALLAIAVLALIGFLLAAGGVGLLAQSAKEARP